jgi:hypothetical protein
MAGIEQPRGRIPVICDTYRELLVGESGQCSMTVTKGRSPAGWDLSRHSGNRIRSASSVVSFVRTAFSRSDQALAK